MADRVEADRVEADRVDPAAGLQGRSLAVMLGRATAALVALTLAGCTSHHHHGAKGQTTTPGGSTSPSPNLTSTPGSAPASSAFTGATSPVSTPPGGPGYLVGVEAAHHPGFDRVVFRFTGALPGYAVTYIDRPVTEDGSGRQVTVAGAGVLQVRMTHASEAQPSDGSVAVTYRGPTRLTPATPTVAEVVRTGDFEGYLTWVVGVRSVSPFKVSGLSDPPRIAVDIESP